MLVWVFAVITFIFLTSFQVNANKGSQKVYEDNTTDKMKTEEHVKGK